MYIDQCLFGYSDGHRLLSTSMSLGEELADLTELSDLAPGAMLRGSDGYWTGVPAPKIGRYALMRTWPAPEMPRPGCVWTQVLLLEPSLLESLTNLAQLSAVFSRPGGAYDQERYSSQLFLDSSYGRYWPSVNPHDNRVLRGLISALYGSGSSSVPVQAPDEADAPLFALWSQQWPRLRRNFRFQTAVSRHPRLSTGSRMDVTLTLGLDDAFKSQPDEDWVNAVVDDIYQGESGFLRNFLWRYGNDVRRQRGSFRPLVAIEMMNREGMPGSGSKLLKLVNEAFPDSNDALLLKQDIIDGVVVPQAQLDVLWVVLTYKGVESLPKPSPQGIARLTSTWRERPQELLHLAEKTARSKDELGQSVFSAISESITSEEFWNLTESHPKVRERMIKARPELLVSESALRLDSDQLAGLLKFIPENHLSVLELLPYLLPRDDSGLVDVLLGRFPEVVAHEIVGALKGGEASVSPAWVRGLVRNPRVLLESKVMERIGRLSTLYEFAERLGWLSDSVIAAGAEPWCAALDNDPREDLSEEKLEMLEAFFIGLALVSGREGGRSLLERYLAKVHELVMKSRLPWRAMNILTPCLPDIGWIRAWDYGLRLRMAVASVYVRWEYPVDSYANLLQGKRMRSLLADAARQIDGGENLARAVNDG